MFKCLIKRLNLVNGLGLTSTQSPAIPNGALATKQQSWDKPKVKTDVFILLENQVDDCDKARPQAYRIKTYHRMASCNSYDVTSATMTLLRLRLAYVRAQILVNLTGCYAARVDVKFSPALLCEQAMQRSMIQHKHLNVIIHYSFSQTGIPV